MWFKTTEEKILSVVPDARQHKIVSREVQAVGEKPKFDTYVDLSEVGLADLVKTLGLDMLITDIPGTKYCQILLMHEPTAEPYVPRAIESPSVESAGPEDIVTSTDSAPEDEGPKQDEDDGLVHRKGGKIGPMPE